jgi:cupin 2 domain-containing protein
MNSKNIFRDLPVSIPEEIFETILEEKKIKIERIISHGHTSPKNFWYDQDTNEFVILLQGAAKLNFEHDAEIELKPGDYLIIPAHKKHRVTWTPPDQKTIWLTIHY